MRYLRENATNLLLIAIILVGFAPTALPTQFYQPLAHAHKLLQRGMLELALDALEQAAIFEPAAAALHQPLLILSLEVGQWDRAQLHLTELNALGISSDIVACAKPRIALATGDVFTPSALDPWLTLCPDIEETLHDLIAEQVRMGNFELAIPQIVNLADRGLASNDELATLAFHTAATAPSRAIDALRAIESEGGDPAGLTVTLLLAIQDSESAGSTAFTFANVGQTFMRAELWHLARLAFQNSVSADPEYAQAWAYLGLASDNTRSNGAASYQEAVLLAPDDPDVLLLQAVHLNRQGDSDLALAVLEHAAALDMENPAIAAELGQAFAKQGDLSSAHMAYRQATILAPDKPAFWYLLAEFSLRYEHQVGELALPAARNAIILDPEDGAAWRSLGYAHYLLGHHSLAARALHRSRFLLPADPASLYFLGLNYMAQGQEHEAVTAWSMAAELSTDHSHAILASRALINLTGEGAR